MTRSGYVLGEFSDSREELRRLEQQAMAVAHAEDQAYLAAGLPERGLGLDMGCGPAFVAERLRRLRPELRLCGVDLDAGSLGEARRSERLVALARSDVHALPFARGTFDLVFSRLVLRHIADPYAVLDEAVRVLRPGGTLVLEDCDDGSIVLEPMPRSFASVLAARHTSLRRRGADPFLARRLYSMLHNLPLKAIGISAIAVTSRDIGVAAFARIVLMPAAEAIDEDLLSPGTIQEAREDITLWGSSPQSFGMTTLLIFRGTRA